ncbi:MAG: class I SAM-dependent methyltransferase [Phycisphaerae bacterium]
MPARQPAADARDRFSTRVADYIRYRPGYPSAALDWLVADHGLAPGQTVADVGSGTGIFTALLLARGCEVFAIEPNAEMRRAAASLLGGEPRFHSVAGSADATGLPPASVDWVFAAQAFHWFDQAAAGPEFRRVLRPGGRVGLLWNSRRTDGPFHERYEAFLRGHAIDYEKVRHEGVEEDGSVRRFLGSSAAWRTFANSQRLDWDGLLGRVRSSSYMPGADHDGYQPMVAALRGLFDQFAENGHVELGYETRVYFGQPPLGA